MSLRGSEIENLRGLRMKYEKGDIPFGVGLVLLMSCF